MTHTPDEIKKGLECCMFGHCSYCPYSAEHGCDCSEYLGNDVREFHQQLESQNAELLTKVEHLEVENKLFMETIGLLHVTENQLETKCHQLEQERDAAVADIPRACGYCKWFEINRGGNMTECHNPNGCRNISGINTGFVWRGVKEE